MVATTVPETKLDWSSYHNVINGELRATSKTRTAVNPATEEALAPVPVSTEADVDAAVAAARAAFPAWSKTSWDEREAKLNALADALEANLPAFTDILIRESGKAIATAQIEAMLSHTFLRGLAALRVPEEVVDDAKEGYKVRLRHLPLGVGAGIVPWNWPLLIGIFKIASCLIAGNVIIVKPSPFAPYAVTKLVELARGLFPPGVIQVLSGGDDLGPWLTEHPGIDKISFTGSSATGKRVLASCSRTLKRVTLELGGNDAAIICEDADLAQAIPKVGTLAFLFSGQICMDIKRVYVHEAIYDKFLAGLVEFVKNIKTGDPNDPDTLVGPLQNSMQYEKVKELFAQIEPQGWKTAVGGASDLKSTHAKGYFMQPTVIDNPPEDSAIVQEEPFGPIVPLLKWSSEEDVIARANDSKMGLGASVWSADIARATRMAEQLEAGSVWVNTHFDLSFKVPFGGSKWSGFNRELGVDGIKGWLEPQSLWVANA